MPKQTTLYIADPFGKSLTIENPPVIPRVGEYITGWFYEPAPVVQKVGYKFEDNGSAIITIAVG